MSLIFFKKRKKVIIFNILEIDASVLGIPMGFVQYNTLSHGWTGQINRTIMDALLAGLLFLEGLGLLSWLFGTVD